MEFLFLGHQSWMVSYKNTHVLIDPILNDSFGHDEIHKIEIFPPRTISFPSNINVKAIILSHEHSDHFHLPTLMQFPKSEIIFGPNMYEFVSDLIQEAGLNCRRVPLRKKFLIGELEFTLYPPHPDTALWEGRVTQIYIAPIDNPESAVFIAVDALISDSFLADIDSGELPQPKVMIVSNNSQITPTGVLGTLDNHKNPHAYIKRDSFGVSILKELLINYLEHIQWEAAVICGGGFTKKYEEFFGAFPFSDQKELAVIAQNFFRKKKIFGPWPGEVIKVGKNIIQNDRVEWISIDYKKLIELKNRSNMENKDPVKNEIRQQTKTTAPEEILIPKCLAALNDFARHFLSTPAGDNAVYKKMIGQSSSNFIMLVKFRVEKNKMLHYGLNIISNYFEPIQKLSLEAEEDIDCGVELFLSDFAAMIDGTLQIWDLAGISMRGWYKGDKFTGPVVAMYKWFGEPSRPDLAYLSLKKRWENFLLRRVA